jgi:hypothetical protein
MDRSRTVWPSLVGSMLVASGASAQTAFLGEIRLERPVPLQDGLFGAALDAEGDTLVVGAPGSFQSSQGAAYVYRAEEARAWGLVRELSLWPSARHGIDVAIDGDWVAVGSTNGIGLYERDQGGPDAWGLAQTIQVSLPFCCPMHQFGTSVALNGEWLFIGDPMLGDLGIPGGPGSVSIYRRGFEDDWILFDEILGASFGLQQLGYSMVADGDLLAVATLAGDVLLFDRNLGGPNDFGLVKAFPPTFSVPSLALEGDRMIVGKTGSSSIDPEGASLYERDLGGPNNWGLAAYFVELRPTEQFAAAVALRGDLAFIGAPALFTGSEGLVYAYARKNGVWEPAGVLDSGVGTFDDGFGSALAATRSALFVGAAHDSLAASKNGAAYVLPWKAPKAGYLPPKPAGKQF